MHMVRPSDSTNAAKHEGTEDICCRTPERKIRLSQGIKFLGQVAGQNDLESSHSDQILHFIAELTGTKKFRQVNYLQRERHVPLVRME